MKSGFFLLTDWASEKKPEKIFKKKTTDSAAATEKLGKTHSKTQ